MAQAEQARKRRTSALDGLDFGHPDDHTVTWGEVSPELLLRAVDSWTGDGNAITLGLTSDGGALSITLLSGGDRRKLYAAGVQEAGVLLSRIAELRG